MHPVLQLLSYAGQRTDRHIGDIAGPSEGEEKVREQAVTAVAVKMACSNSNALKKKPWLSEGRI